MMPHKHRRACSSRMRKQLTRATPRSAQRVKPMLNIWHGTMGAATAVHGASYLAAKACSQYVILLLTFQLSSVPC